MPVVRPSGARPDAVRYEWVMAEGPDGRRRRAWQLSGLAVVALAVVLIAVLVSSERAAAPLRPGRPVPGARSVSALLSGVAQAGAALGDQHAPVTLVEFGDLQCPVCARYARDALPTLIARFVRSGRLRLVYENWPILGRDSMRAARMAIALGHQDRLWQFAGLLYSNQREENSGYVSDDYLRALAGPIAGVDVGSALGDRDSTRTRDELTAIGAQAARLGLRATPSFLLGRTGGPMSRFEPDGLDAAAFTGPVTRLESAPR